MSSRTPRALETLIEKVESFGGRVEALGQRTPDAAFGVEPVEDAPRRAAHAAMAMQRAVERIRGDALAPLATRIAIHAAQAQVAQAGRMIQIDRKAKEQSALVLDDLIAAAEPGGILASPAAGVLLERRFELLPLDGTEEPPSAFRLVGREGPGLSAAGRMASSSAAIRRWRCCTAGCSRPSGAAASSSASSVRPGSGRPACSTSSARA